MKSILLIFPLLLCLILFSCSAPKEETKPPVKEEKAPEVISDEPARAFGITERYYVRSASIAPPTNIEEPLQAIRVIQLQPGANEVLVLFRQEEGVENGESIRYETWLGIEMSSFTPGRYYIGGALQVQFYRFQLAKKGVRYDGTSYTGTITIEDMKEGHLIGSIDLKIMGETRGFDTQSEKFEMTWKGDFRVQEVPLEATIMKSR